ncbi:hypothetical protein D8674_025032 [Pyrus ussuriensis x Pyrus communis]|uniref:Uncharacterized protein n=1 Tax=Pyrus ussuriensis x Pyrus communis TaxID=2448454 RepID=A0A5N5HBL6_9ROSA|nr:hypothetical protein D8674_025032 [Pyrus ussuriensis x Pyrus communis]
MNYEEEMMDCLNITFEDSLDLEERFENTIHLVGRLIADHEPSQKVVKEILRSAWNKMGVVRVQHAKANVYAITRSRILLRLDSMVSCGRVDFDTLRPLMTCFTMPCQKMGSYTIRLKYEDFWTLKASSLIFPARRTTPANGANELH